MLNVLSKVLVMFCRVRSVYVLFVNHSYVLSMFRVRFWLCSVGYVLAMFRLCSVCKPFLHMFRLCFCGSGSVGSVGFKFVLIRNMSLQY